HHGAPTRLLDFTYSPAVAAFFAAADEQKSKHSTVWAVNKSHVRYWSNQRYQTEIKGYKPASPTDLLDTITHEEVDFSDSAVFTQVLSQSTYPGFSQSGFVAVILPKLHNSRLVNQQGLFLANFDLRLPFISSLGDMLSDCKASPIKRFDFPRSIAPDLM